MFGRHVVFTHSPDDYHMDHEMTSRVVRAATFAAPIPQFPRTAAGKAACRSTTFRTSTIAIRSRARTCSATPIRPTFCVDVSEQIEEKAAMLACHASQRDWLIKHHGMDDYLRAMRDWSAQQGRAAGVPFAEGFRQHLGHSYPQDNLVGDLLGGISARPSDEPLVAPALHIRSRFRLVW